MIVLIKINYRCKYIIGNDKNIAAIKIKIVYLSVAKRNVHNLM